MGRGMGSVWVPTGSARGHGRWALAALVMAALVSPTVVARPALAAPSHDAFDDAQVIDGAGTLEGSNVGATAQPGEPDHAGQAPAASVWYSWTPDRALEATIDTEGSSLDTNLAVYTGDTLSGLTEIAAMDDMFGGDATWGRVAFDAEAGTTYRVAVDGYDGLAGSFVLTLAITPRSDARTYDGSGPIGVDLSDRTVATGLYAQEYVPGVGVTIPFNGNIDTCQPGTLPQAYRDAMLQRVNYFRQLVGSPELVYDTHHDPRAYQEAAVLMAANNDLSHDPPSTWKCWTEAGHAVAGGANLSLENGTRTVSGYMSDVGTPDVGHRVWIKSSKGLSLATGDTPRSNVLTVFEDHDADPWAHLLPAPMTRDRITAWPPPGHVPTSVFEYEELEYGLPTAPVAWSLMSPEQVPLTDFSVRTWVRGHEVDVTAEEYHDFARTAVWTPDLDPLAFLGDTTVDVQVDATLEGDRERSFRYRTTFMDPTEVARYAGTDRFETAAALALERWLDGAETVYVASGQAFPDGLAAGQNVGPVLLTSRDQLPEATARAIEALDPDRIVVLGGQAAVGPAVLTALRAQAPVAVHAGTDRYETAAIHAHAQWPSGNDTAVVVTGRAFPDALAAGSLDLPILLTEPQSLPDDTREALVDLGVSEIVVIGGNSAVSADVAGQLEGIGKVTRLSGTDRYETAADVASYRAARGAFEGVYVATGRSFADALGAGGDSRPILLTAPDALPSSTLAALAALEPDGITVLGGTAAVTHEVAAALLTHER